MMANRLEAIKDSIKEQEDNIYQHSLSKEDMKWLIERAEIAERIEKNNKTKYVSFDEALKANAEGKEVKSWLENEYQPYNIHGRNYEQIGSLKLNKFILLGGEVDRFTELRWTIED